MTWHLNVALRIAGPREAEKRRRRAKTRVSRFVNFNSPGSQSLSEEQHDGVIAISVPGVVPSSSAGAMPSRNPPNSPNWILVPYCSVYHTCLMNY